MCFQPSCLVWNLLTSIHAVVIGPLRLQASPPKQGGGSPGMGVSRRGCPYQQMSASALLYGLSYSSQLSVISCSCLLSWHLSPRKQRQLEGGGRRQFLVLSYCDLVLYIFVLFHVVTLFSEHSFMWNGIAYKSCLFQSIIRVRTRWAYWNVACGGSPYRRVRLFHVTFFRNKVMSRYKPA